jgi:ribose transport system substrate-binding protein
MNYQKTFKTCALALGAAAVLAGSITASQAQTSPKKYKVYLSMSYSGNGYQTETSNLIKASWSI